MSETRAVGDGAVAHRPDALIIVADDHLNAFSFNAVPALCLDDLPMSEGHCLPGAPSSIAIAFLPK